jgi:hypothetical protein
MSPEECRNVWLRLVTALERLNEANTAIGGYSASIDAPGVRHRFESLTDEELTQLCQATQDSQAFANHVAQLESIPTPPYPASRDTAQSDRMQSALQQAGPPLFTPAYPTGGNYDAFTATLAGFGLLYDGPDPGTATNDERCDSDGEAAQQIALATEKVVCEAGYAICDALPADFLSVAGRATCFAAIIICKEVTVATEITIAQCALQDGLVDGAEIEAAYENSKIISDQLADHDINIDADLVAHDAHLTEHDTHLSEHDNHLAEHDAKIAAMMTQAQFTLDNVVELRSVHLQVIELTEKREFLVGATEAGIPVSDIEFISVQVSKRNPVSFADVTAQTSVTMVQPGTYLVAIDLPKQLTSADIFSFRVRHNNDVVDHFGFVLFDRSGQNNLSSGL